MRVNKVSFNQLVFICLGIQYMLMHLFSAGEAIVITSIELVIYMIFTVVGLVGFLYGAEKWIVRLFPDWSHYSSVYYGWYLYSRNLRKKATQML